MQTLNLCIRRSVGRGVAVLFLGLAFAGCNDCHRESFFQSDEQGRLVQQIAATQAAAGAAADAMLYPSHFDGTELNSLGRSKVDLALRGFSPEQPATLYLDLPSDDPSASARRDSVQKYLQGSPLAHGSVELKMGPNPNAQAPAAEGLAGLARMQSVGQENRAPGYPVPMEQPAAASLPPANQ